MTNTVFPYPGGKSNMCDWILEHFPRHECYVEVFGGGGSVLFNKPESRVEVFNDRDGDIVHFFETLRERENELVEWLRMRPHAKDLHEKYGRQYYDGYRPDDDVERAGRFFYLRYTQFASKYRTMSGFNSGATCDNATVYYNASDELHDFAGRLRNVQIENRDCVDVIERFDRPGTFYYCDPPYVQEGDALYTGDGFGHERFVSALEGADAKWAVSYTDLPDCFDPPYVATVDEPNTMRNGQGDKKRDHRTERLAMNYDPDETPTHTLVGQTTAHDFAD